MTIPAITYRIIAYCFFDSFSFKKIRERIIETILYAEISGADIMAFPDMAKT
ncbi:MAG: hypothetical protein ACFWTJ_13360 [Lachnoclostridium sp.]